MMDPNDSDYVGCISNYLFGPLDQEARKVFAQARRGAITYQFGMRALARLSLLRREAQRRRLHQRPTAPQAENAYSGL